MIEDPRLLNLIEMYLEGTLSPDEEAELAALLERSPGALDPFRDLLAMDHYLREAVDPERNPEAFRRAVLERLRAADAGPAFRAGVLERIRNQAGGRESHLTTRRVQRLKGEAVSAFPWGWLSMAASLVIGVGLLIYASRPLERPVDRSLAQHAGKPAAVRPEPVRVERVEGPAVVRPDDAAPARITGAAHGKEPGPRPPETVLPPSVPEAVSAAAPVPPAPSATESHPVPPGTPAPPAIPPEPGAPPSAKPETAAVVAALEKVQGPVHVIAAGRREQASSGQKLFAGEGIETGENASARVRWADGTWMGAGPGTAVGRLAGGAAAAGKGVAGKRVEIARGTVTADVSRQPADAPMVFVTPHAEARVLGTRLSLAVEEASTRLEVTEGSVRLVHPESGRSVDVKGGSFATAGRGMEPVARPIENPPENLAAGRPVKASSVFEGRLEMYAPDRGNDGDLNTIWASQGNADMGPWWQVDLGAPCLIRRVEIVARQEADQDQPYGRRNFEVRGANRPDGLDAVVLASQGQEPFPHQGTWGADVTDSHLYRYLRVAKRGYHFTFAEFRAFGQAPKNRPPLARPKEE